MPKQQQIDALADDKQWFGGWYQPIVFPDGSRTHSTKMSDDAFYGADCFGLRKWEKTIAPNLPEPLAGKAFCEVGCNAGLNLIQAREAGASRVVGIEAHPHSAAQCRFVLEAFGQESKVGLVELNALELRWDSGYPFDLVLFANALYWIVYSDERGYIPNHRKRMAAFLRQVAAASRYVLVVGAEESHCEYQSLASTLPALEPFFEIQKAEVVPTNSRTLNVIVGRSK